MIMRQGYWYIERYDTETGSRDWWVELSEYWTCSRIDATPYDTVYLAKAAYIRDGFREKDGRYMYKVQFYDER